MSKQPGNLLTLHINKAVNPVDATRPSIIFHWYQGVLLLQTGAFFIEESLTECMYVCVRVNDGENVSERGRKSQKEGEEGSQAMRSQTIQTGFGLIPSLVLEATSDARKAE